MKGTGGHPGSGSWDHHFDGSLIPRLDTIKGEILKDPLRAALGLLVPCRGGGGLHKRISVLRIKSCGSANDFCSKRGGQARAGEPREDKQADSGYGHL